MASEHEICAVVDTTSSKTPDYMAKAEKLYGKQISTRTWKTMGRVVKAFDV